MERTPISQTIKKIGIKVKICGWVDSKRDHGKLVFLDIRDRTGTLQVVADTSFSSLRPEDVVEVEGEISKRPEKLVNKNLATGEIELQAKSFKLLAKAADLPFETKTDGRLLGEELRLKYRYLDLRRPRMVKNMELRHQMIKFIRDWLGEKGFLESVKVFKPEKTSVKRLHIELAVEENVFTLTEARRVSRPGRRIYRGADEIGTYKRGFGVMVVSTSKGIMSSAEARKKKIGGEIICEVY